VVDLLVLGSGVAGLSAAIRAVRTGLSVAVVTKGDLTSSTTRYAQGGIAAALTHDDSPELHRSDTLTAGAGLCDGAAVDILVTEGPRRVRELIELGARFDRDSHGDLALAREGGHSVARVLHAGGDATGAEIERALVVTARSEVHEVRERGFALELLVEAGRVCGVVVLDESGQREEVRARHTVLATGGAGQLFSVTTNPVLSTGDGVAMARRAGAVLADVEFVQFHPTALHYPAMPRPLLSEALRGEGAILRDDAGRAFMTDEHPMADLAPRDVAARAIARRLRDRDLEHLWLDATPIADIEHRFPTIWSASRSVGLDPRRDWLPVAPAAHYSCGGVATDLDGATTLPGLWAIGETACVGVHGANRLASNSLLDGLVFAARTVESVQRGKDGPDDSGVLRGAPPAVTSPAAHFDGAGSVAALRDDLQRALTLDAGVLRDAASLERAAKELNRIRSSTPNEDSEAAGELRNLVTVAERLVAAATRREESRGTHTRLDFPDRNPRFVGRFLHTGGDDPVFVPVVDSTVSP
jgi:L-aspartate oxidase